VTSCKQSFITTCTTQPQYYYEEGVDY